LTRERLLCLISMCLRRERRTTAGCFSLFGHLLDSQTTWTQIISRVPGSFWRIQGKRSKKKEQWHSREPWTSARLVIRLFILLIWCLLKGCLIINPASNAATAKELLWYVFLSLPLCSASRSCSSFYSFFFIILVLFKWEFIFI
jgi:hypothetical protein